MRKSALLIIFLSLLIGTLVAQQSEYFPLKSEAEKSYAEGSYARAHELYKTADAMTLPAVEARWVDFRLADTLWRSHQATTTPDPTVFEQAQKQLKDLVTLDKQDWISAEAHESLGDFFWLRRDVKDWNAAWQNYVQALDWWAGSDQLENAKRRYLSIVNKIAQPSSVDPHDYYGYHGNYVPVEVLENGLKLSTTDQDRAHFHYLLGMTLRNQGDPNDRAVEEFAMAIQAGKQSDWYDDALFHYAQLLENKLEFKDALNIYRRITAEFSKGETRYFDQAAQQIATITKPSIDLRVANLFLPESEVEFHVTWRNLQKIQFALYKVDLLQDIALTQNANWIQSFQLSAKKPLQTWNKEGEIEKDFKPHQEMMKLDSKLGLGAYILEASGGSVQSRDLILVTDATLVSKAAGSRMLLYFADARTGAPLANAAYKVSQKFHAQSSYDWRHQSGKTDQDGIGLVQFTNTEQSTEFFAAAGLGNRQAFTTGHSYNYTSQSPAWRIYAFTDRPAYRPGEEVQWKFIARLYDGSVYSTPANQSVEYEIYDPRGTKIKEAKVTLNSFGSAWDKIQLTAEMPLGEYRLNFYDQERRAGIGSSTLFRLEEYKLPEFKVAIRTPEKDGKKKSFLSGEQVEATIHAEYYFGGPVPNATVEVLVYQNPFYQWWYPHHEYPWYYESIYQNPYRNMYGGGQIVKRETLKTDTAGMAIVRFDTPRNSAQDFEYRVEARVTDAARREITATDTVRVTRQRYYVYPHPKHFLYRPGARVIVDFKTLDANGQPHPTEGQVKLTRDFYYEIWIDANGKEKKVLAGDPRPAKQHWRLKFQGYQHDDIKSQTVQTDAKGEAEFSFTPEQTGYYRIAWNSGDKKNPVQGETTVWVTTGSTTEIGYRYGNVQIIADRDTFYAGEKVPVLLTVPTNDRYVLFSMEGDDLYSYQLVRMNGTVKLLELEIQEKHVPNIFLSAALVSDYQLSLDTKEVIVPPVQQFLNIQVEADREEYQPQQQATLTVTASDSKGKPVSAEIALGLTDESVTYIQQDYAGDPRRFFYGTKRRHLIQTQSLYQNKAYKREDQLRSRGEYNEEQLRALGYVGGKLGGAADSRAAQEREGNRDWDNANFFARGDAKEAVLAEPPPAPAPAPESAVQVRSDFRSTAFWQPDIATDAQGRATVNLKYPDSLTSWNAVARVSSASSQFGTANIRTRTKKPLLVRLQAPRFFVAGDTVTLSANVNNNTDETLNVRTDIDVQGLQVEGSSKTISIAGNSEQRLDWNARVAAPGMAKVTVSVRGAGYSDAMEKTYPVYDHGIEKFAARSGKVRGNDISVNLDLPSRRRSPELSIQVTPSMAVTLLDALPYLIDYPYGCTEQTMSRFLPAVITAKTLRELGLPSDRIFETGGIEKRTVEKTHPQGRKSLQQLPAMLKAGLNRLYDFQHPDGGWGWWKDGESDHFMTGYVIWGFTLAKNAGVEVRGEVLQKGVTFLQKELVEQEEHFDMQAWMLHALAAASSKSRFEEKAFANLWKNRDKLNAYTRALLALSAAAMGHAEEAQVLIRNLENGVKLDATPDQSILIGGRPDPSAIGTAHWGEDGIYRRWSDGGVEATAFALKALLAIDPGNKLVEPVTNWLIKNRRGAQWSSTRDTAIVVLALNDYLRVSGELKVDLEFELLVNGQMIAHQAVAPEDVLAASSQFSVKPELIRDRNEIRIRRTRGSGPIYFAVQAKYFSLEEPVTAAGNEIFVRRQYFKLAGKPTLLKGYLYDRLPFADLSSVKSGERVEVVIQIEAKNNYEYLIFEDLKPAGLEAVAIRSGESVYARELKSGKVQTSSATSDPDSNLYTSRTRWVYQELRDRKVALFIDKLPEGIWEIRYDLRAEVPGQYHALPLLGYAMYVPEIRSNSEELRISVQD